MKINRYSSPIKLKKNVKVSYDISPAHKDRLKHSIDFIIEEGTSIFAAASSVVVNVKDDSYIGGKEKKSCISMFTNIMA